MFYIWTYVEFDEQESKRNLKKEVMIMFRFVFLLCIIKKRETCQ